MSDLYQQPEDATPLEPLEKDGLIPSWVISRADLNLAEQDNIIQGANWATQSRRISLDAMLSTKFAMELHQRMFGDVWKWAGKYRKTERNIGIEAYRLPAELSVLFSDISFWVANMTFSDDEIAVRLHHRLVFIHPFPNGNGRHARLMADLLIIKRGGHPFSWGGGQLQTTGALRASYVAALRAADGHDVGPLIGFARA